MNIGEIKTASTEDEMRRVLAVLIPVAEAVLNLHEFNNKVGFAGPTPAQEMERVHLFEDYLKAVEGLING